MAIDQGYEGSVYIDASQVAEINAWSATFSADTEDITTFGSDARKRGYTLKDASGSFSGFGDKSDTDGQNALLTQFLDGGTPAAVWLYLYVSGSAGYYGEATVSIDKAADVQSKQTFSASFEAADKWYTNI
jgi:hypothetical protein